MPTFLSNLRSALLALGICLVVAAVCWPALHGGFIFDDYPIFAENPAIHVTGWSWEQWHNAWTWSHDNVQRPLAMLTYALNYALGNDTFGFKFTNLVIHLLNTILVALLTVRLLAAYWKSGEDEPQPLYWSLGVAAAWALHPLQISTIMYVVQRMELLGFTFTLLALLAYWHARQRQIQGLYGWPWLLLSGTLAVVGFAAKETVVLTPAYALLMEVLILNFAAKRPNVGKLWKVFFSVGCILAALAFTFYFLPRYASHSAFTGRGYDAWQRELTQLRVLPMYLGWCFAPIPSHLVFYYDNYVASKDLLHPASTLLGGLLLLSLVIAGIAVRKKRPLLAFGIGWFFVAHALTSGPIALELVFEHRNYPALLGVVLAAVDLFYGLSNRFKSPLPAILGVVLIANLCFLTTLRSLVWSSPFQLASTLAENNPGSTRAAMDLARRFMAMSGGNGDSPLFSMSIQELQRASKLSTDSPLPEEALLLIAADHPGMATAPLWDSLQTKLRTRPMIPDTYQVLHRLLTQRVAGKEGIDASRLAEIYAIAASRNPDRQPLQADYAELAGAALHDPELAIAHWEIALKLDKNPGQYGQQLASYLAGNQRNREAMAVIEKTWQLVPASSKNAALIALHDSAKKALQTPAPPISSHVEKQAQDS